MHATQSRLGPTHNVLTELRENRHHMQVAQSRCATCNRPAGELNDQFVHNAGSACMPHRAGCEQHRLECCIAQFVLDNASLHAAPS